MTDITNPRGIDDRRLQTSAPTMVVGSSGDEVQFYDDLFAGSLLKSGMDRADALQATAIVQGVLAGARSATDDDAGLQRVSKQALKVMKAEFVENPRLPDFEKLGRTLIEFAPPALGGESLGQLYSRLATTVGVVPMGVPRFALAGSITQWDGSRQLGRQEMTIVAGADGRLREVTAGVVTAAHDLSLLTEGAAIPNVPLAVTSVEEAERTLASLHPLFAPLRADDSGLSFRAVTLSNQPDPAALAASEVVYGPRWVGLAATPTTAVITIVNAASGRVEMLTTTTPVALGLAGTEFFTTGFDDVWDFVLKVASLVAGYYAIVALAAVLAAGAETVIVPLLAAFAMVVVILGMVVEFINIVLELAGEKGDCDLDAVVKKIETVRAEAERSQKGVKDGTISQADGRSALDQAFAEFDAALAAAEKCLKDAGVGDDAATALKYIRDAASLARVGIKGLPAPKAPK
jgi:hypothetical protein